MSMGKRRRFRLGGWLGSRRIAFYQPSEMIRDVFGWGCPRSGLIWIVGVGCRRDRFVSRFFLRGPLVLILAHAAGL